MRFFRTLLILLSVLPALGAGARAESNFPSHAVTVVVPFSAGGATDIMGRLLSREASGRLGQPFIVENRGGAAGAIGANVVVRSPPDGYTVCLCGGGPMVLLKLIDPKQLPYDPSRDFTPITISHKVDYVVGVATSSPYKSMADLVADAKEKPGQLSYASTGTGGPAHLGQEYFNQIAGVQITHVPYKGENDFIPDLTSGRVTMALISAELASRMVKGGQVRLLGAWSKQRIALLPNLPTVAEQGWPSFEAGTFVAITAPRGTPADVVNKLNEAFVKATQTPEVKAKMAEMGFTPVGNSPSEAAAFLRDEDAKWGKVVNNLGLKSR